MDTDALAFLIAMAEEPSTPRTNITGRFMAKPVKLEGGRYTLLDAKGPGKLYEASLRFTGDVTIYLDVDGVVIQGDYQTIYQYSSMTSRIDAYEDDGDKVIRFNDIPFKDHLLLVLTGTGRCRIVARWDETIK